MQGKDEINKWKIGKEKLKTREETSGKAWNDAIHTHKQKIIKQQTPQCYFIRNTA